MALIDLKVQCSVLALLVNGIKEEWLKPKICYLFYSSIFHCMFFFFYLQNVEYVYFLNNVLFLHIVSWGEFETKLQSLIQAEFFPEDLMRLENCL